MFDPSTVKNTVIAAVACLIPGVALASGEVPLTWKSLRIQSAERGGAELEATVDDDGNLERLSLTVKGRNIPIPPRCLKGLVRPYLNGISIRYGQFESGQDYWSVEVPFDGTGSVELEATFSLVLSDRDLLWSYRSIQVDDTTWENRDVCALAQDVTS